MAQIHSGPFNIKTYQQAEDFIMEALPMFQKVGKKAIGTYSLDRVLALLEYLDNPHHDFKSIHIAGTNGKGSVSHMLAAIYHQNNYKTGLFTSPHFISYRERIRINGANIPEEVVLDWVQKHHDFLLDHRLSFFEMSMGLAFSYFSEVKVDVAIIETGLGGRLDATNVINPILSVVTNIDYDHQDILGDTLELIAEEKAGIIKPDVPVVLGNIEPALYHIFERKANDLGTEIIYSDKSLIESLESTDDGIVYNLVKNTFPGRSIELPTFAPYQRFNLNTILHALPVLNRHDSLRLAEVPTVKGLEKFTVLSQFRGRYEVVHENPLIIADAAHNPAGIRFFSPLFKNNNVHLHLVLGFVSGKDLHGTFSLLPDDATYYFCAAKVPRAMDAYKLQKEAQKYNLQGKVWPSPKQAVNQIILNADKDDVGLILGSIYLIAEIL